MDEPARKRRRTNSPEEHNQHPSPLKKPPRRPSFASPTKSSLARNYPDLMRANSTAAPAVRPSKSNPVLVRNEQARPLTVGGMEERDSVFRAERTLRRSPLSKAVQNDDRIEVSATQPRQGIDSEIAPHDGSLVSSPSKRQNRVTDPVEQSASRPEAHPVQEDGLIRAVEGGPVAQTDTLDGAQAQQPLDLELEARRQEKARLQHEIDQLESNVARWAEEVVKEQQRSPDQSLQAPERTHLLNLITEISGVNTEKDRPAPVSSLLCSFLPFSVFPISQPQSNHPERPVPSHRPVELTDPMPYLEMFTSLKFSTQLSLPRGKVFSSSNRVYQKHTIDITGPQNLLRVQLSVLLDTQINEIIDLRILRSCSWAERELGIYIRQRAEKRDLGNICWAIDSYWDIARKRAQYWYACETSFAHLIAGKTTEDRENVRPGKSTQNMTRKDLNRHLRRDTLMLQDKNVLLKFRWRIGFDWTGEAESDITVEPAFPKVWSEADTAAGLKKVPDTFASLLRSKGAFEATRIMVALLFAQPG